VSFYFIPDRQQHNRGVAGLFCKKKLSIGLFPTAGKRMYSTTIPATHLPNGMFIMAILGDRKKLTAPFISANNSSD
jgi:hypothetical protein